MRRTGRVRRPVLLRLPGCGVWLVQLRRRCGSEPFGRSWWAQHPGGPAPGGRRPRSRSAMASRLKRLLAWRRQSAGSRVAPAAMAAASSLGPLDDEARATVATTSGPSRGQGHDRRAAGHRLDHHHAERLVPQDREDQAAGPGEQAALLGAGRRRRPRPRPARAAARSRPGVVLLLDRLGALAGQEDPDPGRARRVDREVRALCRVETTEEEDVVVLVGRGTGSCPRRYALWTVPTQFRSGAERRWCPRSPPG